MGQGTLTLPPGGTVYVDTQILIYTVERHPVYGPALQPAWQAVKSQSLGVATSEIAVLEALVTPIRHGDAALRRDYESVLFSPDTHLVPVSRDVLLRAAALRAAVPRLRTPDAIHAAAALGLGCSMFLTNDTDFRGVPGLPVTILDDVLQP